MGNEAPERGFRGLVASVEPISAGSPRAAVHPSRAAYCARDEKRRPPVHLLSRPAGPCRLPRHVAIPNRRGRTMADAESLLDGWSNIPAGSILHVTLDPDT